MGFWLEHVYGRVLLFDYSPITGYTFYTMENKKKFMRHIETTCLGCKSAEKPHKAKGYCENCYRKFLRKQAGDKDLTHPLIGDTVSA